MRLTLDLFQKSMSFRASPSSPRGSDTASATSTRRASSKGRAGSLLRNDDDITYFSMNRSRDLASWYHRMMISQEKNTRIANLLAHDRPKLKFEIWNLGCHHLAVPCRFICRCDACLNSNALVDTILRGGFRCPAEGCQDGVVEAAAGDPSAPAWQLYCSRPLVPHSSTTLQGGRAIKGGACISCSRRPPGDFFRMVSEQLSQAAALGARAADHAELAASLASQAGVMLSAGGSERMVPVSPKVPSAATGHPGLVSPQVPSAATGHPGLKGVPVPLPLMGGPRGGGSADRRTALQEAASLFGEAAALFQRYGREGRFPS